MLMFTITSHKIWLPVKQLSYKVSIEFKTCSCQRSSAVSRSMDCEVIYLFILFYLPHNNYKKYRKRRKKKWRGDLTETIGAYERLGLLELWARAVSHQLKKRRRKVEDGKTYELFSYLLNNLIFSFFLKEERDWELMILLSSELKNLFPWKKGENFFVFVRQYGRW